MWYNSQKLSILLALFASLSCKRGVWWQLYILAGICILWQSLQSVSVSSSLRDRRTNQNKASAFCDSLYSHASQSLVLSSLRDRRTIGGHFFFFQNEIQGQLLECILVKDCYSNLKLDRSNFILSHATKSIIGEKNSLEWQKSIIIQEGRCLNFLQDPGVGWWYTSRRVVVSILLVSTYVVCERLSVMHEPAGVVENLVQILQNTLFWNTVSEYPPPPKWKLSEILALWLFSFRIPPPPPPLKIEI